MSPCNMRCTTCGECIYKVRFRGWKIDWWHVEDSEIKKVQHSLHHRRWVGSRRGFMVERLIVSIFKFIKEYFYKVNLCDCRHVADAIQQEIFGMASVCKMCCTGTNWGDYRYIHIYLHKLRLCGWMIDCKLFSVCWLLCKYVPYPSCDVYGWLPVVIYKLWLSDRVR
jgi:hypothetical protein